MTEMGNVIIITAVTGGNHINKNVKNSRREAIAVHLLEIDPKKCLQTRKFSTETCKQENWLRDIVGDTFNLERQKRFIGRSKTASSDKQRGMSMLSGALNHLGDRKANPEFNENLIDAITIILSLQISVGAESSARNLFILPFEATDMGNQKICKSDSRVEIGGVGEEYKAS